MDDQPVIPSPLLPFSQDYRRFSEEEDSLHSQEEIEEIKKPVVQLSKELEEIVELSEKGTAVVTVGGTDVMDVETQSVDT